ncbi:hypothetical protein M406DRAFT_280414, partial [Cryphonectria parasitica EP155]
MVRLLVGPNRTEFIIHKKLLCGSSSFFRYSLESVSTPSSPASAKDGDGGAVVKPEKVLWLSEESPEMVDLFLLWLYQRSSFRNMLENMVAAVTAPAKGSSQVRLLSSRRALHWNLVKLHLFAAVIRLPVLQDIAMDAIQDLYLRCDWDVSVNFVRFLYEECTCEQAFRIRKWTVAMLAWTLSNGSADPLAFNDLFAEFPDLCDDYTQHMQKMIDSRADVRVKNPQLRLPRNRLKNEERHFGYRQCSFHSHRSSVGEGRCPY